MIYLVIIFIAFKPLNAENIESLCDNPVIYTADRLTNDSVRLYRNNHYWELTSLPNIEATLTGPYRVWSPYMAPIHNITNIVTLHGGRCDAKTFKIEKTFWWMWSRTGWIEEDFGSDYFGQHTSHLLLDDVGGYDVMIHNGNKSNPLLIGLKFVTVDHKRSTKLFYFSNGDEVWKWSLHPNSRYPGYLGGLYGENFPPDLDAAFSWPSLDQQSEYYVYMFKGDKYCFRPQIAKIDATKNESIACEKWRESRELFGCYKSGQIKRPLDQNGVVIIDNNTNTNNTKEPSDCCCISRFNNLLIALFLTLNTIFRYV